MMNGWEGAGIYRADGSVKSLLVKEGDDDEESRKVSKRKVNANDPKLDAYVPQATIILRNHTSPSCAVLC